MGDSLRNLADKVAAAPSNIRLRQGIVIATLPDSFCEVFIGGDVAVVAVVPYLGPFPPRPGSTVWIAVDGADAFIIGSLAPESLPVAKARIATAALPAVATGTATTIAYADVYHDPWNMCDGSGFTAPVAGVYDVDARLFWAANATGERRLRVLVNGGSELDDHRAGHATEPTVNHSRGLLELAAGDQVRVEVRQTSGGTLNVGAYKNFATLTYVAPLPAPVADITGLVDNPGFEAGLDGWTVDRPTDWTADTSVYDTGVASAKFTATSGATLILGAPVDIPTAAAQGGTNWAEWRLDARVKASDPAATGVWIGVVADSRTESATGTPAQVSVLSAGQPIDDAYGAGPFTATTAWSTISTGNKAQLPPGTRTVRPFAYFAAGTPAGPFTINVDNIELTLVAWQS